MTKTCGVCLKDVPEAELSHRRITLRLVDLHGNPHVVTMYVCNSCAWKDDPRKGKVWNR